MMIRKNKKLLFSLITICGTILMIGQIVYAINKEPGSTEDPLVTLSFVEQRIDQLKGYIDEKIKTTPSTGGAVSLEVVNLKAGENLIAYQGTEIILRSGRAVIIDSPAGGISNLTSGFDLRKGERIPQNHLLLVPRTDGRGAKAETATVFMVRGAYRIEQ